MTFATDWQGERDEVRCPVCRKLICTEHKSGRARALRLHVSDPKQVAQAQTIVLCRCKTMLEIRRQSAA